MENKSFIEKSKLIHNNKYDYSLVNYINSYSKVKIICQIHGEFEQTPKNHLRGCNCPKCSSYLKSGRNLNKESFIEKSNLKHSYKYDYSLVNYINSYSKIKIICPIHGIFEQRPHHHYNGSGCPKCKNSKGETIISNFLKTQKIIFIPQKKFDDCKFKYPLPFDFYLPEQNICIEYDGEQHFKPMNIWGGYENFELIKIRDNIKTEYCKKNGIKLLRIKYNEIDLDILKMNIMKK